MVVLRLMVRTAMKSDITRSCSCVVCGVQKTGSLDGGLHVPLLVRPEYSIG